MCSKNQKVGHLIRPIHNKSLFDSEIFSSFAKFVFSEQTTLPFFALLKKLLKNPQNH